MIANAVPSLEQHPYPADAGADAGRSAQADPALTDLDLGREYHSCMEAFGYRWEDMVAIALDGVEATWLDDPTAQHPGAGGAGGGRARLGTRPGRPTAWRDSVSGGHTPSRRSTGSMAK